MTALSREIVALERSALDSWITLDPQGYLNLIAPAVTYFDPLRDKRIDGLEALKALLASIKQFRGTITEPRYEMIDPKVQQYGDVALLTYNLTNYGKLSGGPEAVLARWNSSEEYAGLGNVEACPQPLVVHKTGLLNPGLGSSRQLVSADALK